MAEHTWGCGEAWSPCVVVTVARWGAGVETSREYHVTPCEGRQFIPAYVGDKQTCPSLTVICNDCEPPDFTHHAWDWNDAHEAITDHELDRHPVVAG